MAATLPPGCVSLSGVGCFGTPDGWLEVVRWTHRDPSYGWDVRAGDNWQHVSTKAEAVALARRLLRERKEAV